MDTGVATLQAKLTGRLEGYGASERTASTPLVPAGGRQILTGHIGNLTDSKASHRGRSHRMAGVNFDRNLQDRGDYLGVSSDLEPRSLEQNGRQPATALELWFAPYFI